MRSGQFVVSLIVLGSAVIEAQAECTVRGGRFFVAQNDTVEYSATVTGDGKCERDFSTDRSTFKSTTIAKRPSNGAISTNGVSNFKYAARAGFKGKDSFVVKVCGEGLAGSGCSTLNYEVDVQ